MIPQSLLIISVLFQSFHAFPVNETLEKEVPITNNDVKLTEEVSSFLSDVTAEEKLGEVGPTEQAKADPAKFASQSNDENILKKLEECKKVAKKSEDFSWSIRKECLKMFLAEANKQQNELKVLLLRLNLRFKDCNTYIHNSIFVYMSQILSRCPNFCLDVSIFQIPKYSTKIDKIIKNLN